MEVQTMSSGFPGKYIIRPDKEERKAYEESYFYKAMQSWEENSKECKITQEELEQLKNQYNSGRMSDKQRVDFLGELVSYGVISKETAIYIYGDITPIDVNKSLSGKLTAVKNQTSYSISPFAGMDVALKVKGFDYYNTMYEEMKSHPFLDTSDKPFFAEYERFLGLLKKLQ